LQPQSANHRDLLPRHVWSAFRTIDLIGSQTHITPLRPGTERLRATALRIEAPLGICQTCFRRDPTCWPASLW